LGVLLEKTSVSDIPRFFIVWNFPKLSDNIQDHQGTISLYKFL